MDKSDDQATPAARAVVNNSEHNRYRQVPMRVAIFSAVLLPMVLVPYLLTMRRTGMLRHRIDELQNANHALSSELGIALAKLAAGKAENQGIKARLHAMMVDTDVIRDRVARLEAREKKVLEEGQHSRTQTAALKALGSSLADIAAFMHETELQMGLQPQRRVDGMRITALRLQNLSQ